MNIERFSLDQLRVFIQVADSGSFLAAARALRRAQSAVSYAISALEAQLGLRLFDREHYRPQLTLAGFELLRDARQILSQVDALQLRAATYVQGSELSLTLALDVFFPTAALVSLLQNFKEKFPTITLRLEIDALGAVLERVVKGEAMLGVLITLPVVPSHILQINLPPISLIGVVSPSHPLAQWKGRIPRDVLEAQVQLVLSDRSTLTMNQDFSVHSSLVWRMSDMAVKHDLLRAGMGWGYMPQHVVAEDLAQGKLIRITSVLDPPQGIVLPVQCVYRPDRQVGPALKWWLETLSNLEALE